MKKSKFNQFLVFLFIFCLIITISLLIYIHIDTTYHVVEHNTSKTIDLISGWYYFDESNSKRTITLPATVITPSSDYITFSRKLPQNLPEFPAIYMKTNNQLIKARINGMLLSTSDNQINRSFQLGYSDTWVVINLPPDSAGKVLEVTIQSLTGSPKLIASKIMLGHKDVILRCLTRQSMILLGMTLPIMVIAIVLLLTIICIKVRNRSLHASRYVYLGLFILLASIWIYLEGNIWSLATQRINIPYYLSFFTFFLIPIPFLLFIRETCTHGKQVFNFIAVLFIINFVLNVVISTIYRFNMYRVLYTMHILILLTVISTIIICIRDLVRYNNTQIRGLLPGLGILSILTLVSIYQYYFKLYVDNWMCFQLGLIMFILCISVGAILRGGSLMMQTSNFQKIATTIPCGVCRSRFDENLSIIYANDHYYEMLGYTAEEVKTFGITRCNNTIYEPDIHHLLKQARNNINKRIYNFDIELREIKKDATLMWVLAKCHYDPSSDELTIVNIDITARKNAEEQLRIREEEYRIAVSHSDKYVIRYDIKTKTTYQTPEAAKLFGLPDLMENVPYSLLNLGIIAPESITDFVAFYQKILRGEKSGTSVVYLRNISGGFAWYQADFTMIYSDEGEPLQAIVSYNDVTELREKELAYERWRQIIEEMPQEEFYLVEHNLTQEINSRIEGTLLCRYIPFVIDSLDVASKYLVDHVIYPEDRLKFESLVRREILLARYTKGERELDIDFRVMSSSHAPYWLHLNIQMVAYPNSQDIKVFLLFQDIDKKKRSELLLESQSKEDPLTGLLNRAAFIEETKRHLAENPDQMNAIMILDIDYFKKINDTLGHMDGDDVLCEVARTMREVLRRDDLLGRLGGDEFIICLKNISNVHTCSHCAEKLRANMKRRIRTGLYITVSIGIAVSPMDGNTFEELYRNADSALYSAKNSGRNRYSLYHPAN